LGWLIILPQSLTLPHSLPCSTPRSGLRYNRSIVKIITAQHARAAFNSKAG
jgi:hypothetical protein